MDEYYVVIASSSLPCSITLVITFQMFYIADLLIYYIIDIVGYPVAVLLTVPIAVIGYYFVAMVLAIVVPFWVAYHTTLYTHSRVKRLIYPYGPYRHDRHNALLCGHVDKTKMNNNKFKKILFLLLLFILPSTSAPSPSPSLSTNATTTAVATAIAVAAATTVTTSGRGRKRKISSAQVTQDHTQEEDIDIMRCELCNCDIQAGKNVHHQDIMRQLTAENRQARCEMFWPGEPPCNEDQSKEEEAGDTGLIVEPSFSASIYGLQTSEAAQQLFNKLSTRVPDDDLIVRTLEEIGKYGKEINYGNNMPELVGIVKNEIKSLHSQAIRESQTPNKKTTAALPLSPADIVAMSEDNVIFDPPQDIEMDKSDSEDEGLCGPPKNKRMASIDGGIDGGVSSRGRKRTLSKKKKQEVEEDEEKKKTKTKKMKKKTKKNDRRNEKRRARYANMNDDKKDEHLSKRREDYANMEDDKKDEHLSKMKDYAQERYDNMSDDEKEARKSQMRDYAQERYDNMSDDEKEARISQISDNKSKQAKKKVGLAFDQDISQVEPFSLGKMDETCSYCGAKGYKCENKGSKLMPHFGGLCCNQGKVTVKLARDFKLHKDIKELLTSNTKEAKFFRKHSVSHFVHIICVNSHCVHIICSFLYHISHDTSMRSIPSTTENVQLWYGNGING